MKVVKRSERKMFRNSERCTVYEYQLRDKDINGALAVITGRYPDKGYAVNRRCKELVYVLKGRGRIGFGRRTVSLKTGDMLLIRPKERYYWDGNMTIVMPCTPAWYPKQHVLVDA